MAYVDGRTYTAHHHHHHHHRLQQRPNTVRQPKNNNNNKSHTKTEKNEEKNTKEHHIHCTPQTHLQFITQRNGPFPVRFCLTFIFFPDDYVGQKVCTICSLLLALSFSLALCILLLVGLRFIFHNLSPIEIGLSFATPH